MGKGAAARIFTGFSGEPLGQKDADGVFTSFSGEPLWRKALSASFLWAFQWMKCAHGAVGCVLATTGQDEHFCRLFLQAFQATPVGKVNFCVEGCLSWWLFVAACLWPCLCGLLCGRLPQLCLRAGGKVRRRFGSGTREPEGQNANP